ncbi:DUF397 domain-containing protein [Streptomyces sp. URMC 124]|uniref:DUF397 domain-containing protein n=1 Tax=Streptomyces sp. URMC 124 TaxID=3423405 RepID=UPI003F1DF80B
MSQVIWQKSSYSASTTGNECVEVAAAGGSALIRESDDPGTVITTPPGSLRALILALRAGALHAAGDVSFGVAGQGLR